MNKKKNLFVLMISGAVSIFLIEWYFSGKMENYTSLSSRYYQPYIGFGDFRSLTASQSPADFGYKSKSGIFVYHPSHEITSLNERFKVLSDSVNGNPRDPSGSKNAVIVMGGSAALGDRHSNPDSRFFLQVQKRLRTFFGNESIDVFPAAVRGFNSTQERVLLDLYVLPLKPRAIFFLHGFNDANQWEYLSRPGDPYNTGLEYSRLESRWFRVKQLLADWSYFGRWLFINSSEKFIEDSFQEMVGDSESITNYSKSLANIYVQNVIWMSKRCEQEKVFCFFLLQPAYLKGGENRQPLAYLEMRNQLSKSSVGNLYAKVFDFGGNYNHRVDLFVDSVHMNDEGQMILAEDVVERAAPFLKNVFRGKSDNQ